MSNTDNLTPNGSDEWDFGGSPTQTDNSDDIWGDTMSDPSSWDSQPQGQSQDIDWGTPQSNGQFLNDSDNWDNWDAQQETPSQATEYVQDSTSSFEGYGQQQGGYINDPRQPQKANINFGKKTVGLIIAGACIILALILLFADSIKITKVDKNTGNQQNQQQQVQNSQNQNNNSENTDKDDSEKDTNTENNQNTENGNSSSETDKNNKVLVEIPYTTTMRYSSDTFQTNGTVVDKVKLVQGNQIIYCIEMKVAIGKTTQTLNYYCNYSSYNAVSIGDLLVISYQQVNDSFISVSAISK